MDWKSYEPLIIPDIADLQKIGVYEDNDGYTALRSILDDQDKWSTKNVTEEVKAANIKGRGGAGFNCGLKWSFMPEADDRPRYLACNGDESEGLF
jgi:NADH-quinone oxidoreductase subunit F